MDVAESTWLRVSARCPETLQLQNKTTTCTLIQLTKRTVSLASLIACLPMALMAQSSDELRQRVDRLESELAEAKAALANAADTGPSKIQLGNLSIGGAIRVNYVFGDYESGPGATRGSSGGNMMLDTYRINLDYVKGPWSAKAEYRWYNGYNMLHTGWLGYTGETDWSVQVGVNRVPFGPGAYGVSNSWFFDQHFYVGLADDMDLGVKYTTTRGDLTWDFAYYVTDEGNYVGASRDSARYSYDPVMWTYEGEKRGYEERHQVNVRVIADLTDSTDLGASLQAGQLEGEKSDDGSMVAGSVHMVNTLGKWRINSQLTYYNYDIGAGATGDDELIPFGAYDYAWPIATEAVIPAIAVSYSVDTGHLDWLDSLTLYAEYSSILKTGSTADGTDFKDSSLAVFGAAWARGGWYIYTDLAFSDGNYFVGLDDFTTQGANLNASWQSRLNINFGYYF